MGRLAWYAGVSTALAAGVVASAFNQRANFYSACVYLQQSNLCLMVLINLILLLYSSLMYGLQRLCYGSLRPIEIEQLYEKGWFAVTETCLAMTIFREEVGPWFLVMFVALITGKVWGWIGDGRVEILEQQPPANPRLFHFRLSVSLAISVIYDIWLMTYTISAVIQQARPNMMVMFLFEFTILTTSSVSTGFRYLISLRESSVVKQQTRERLIERRREVREERAEMIRQREEAAAAAAAGSEGSSATPSEEPLPSEDDVNELDIEVPGWESKGQWILSLDLITDFAKLIIYLTFFFILLLFYGIPIHIMRDLFMTTRSFVKRLTAFLRYRRATQDMNKRYGDATVEDIEREDTCIICREEMRPWSVTNPQAPPVAPGALPPARPAAPVNERSRPKKLPCGHILHLGCLRSWLERQQVCPTCRRPVVENARAARNAANNANQGGQGARPPGGNHPGGAGAAPAPGARPPGRGMRMLNLGPLRVGFGQANLEDIEALGGGRPGDQNAARVYGLELGFPRRQQPQPQLPEVANNPASIHDHLQQIEQQIMAEIRDLQVMEQELQLVRLLQTELARLRLLQIPGPTGDSQPQVGVRGARHAASSTIPQLQQHAAHADALPIPAGGADLPPGVVIPEGWSLLPLQRMDGPGARPSGTAPPENTRPIPTPTTTQWSTSSIPPIPPITRNPIPRTDPEHRSPSSSDSSDANATHTPPATSDDQSNSTVLPTPETTSIPASSTSAAPATSDSPVLPSWSTSQLFSGPGQATATRTGHENPTSVPDSTRGGFPVDAGQSSSLSSPVAGDDAEETPEQRARGTARAATVEDTIDDADGS